MGSNTYGGRPAHPAAEVFPAYSEDRIKELADDIRDNGLQQPVVETVHGRILDGRARLLACDLAGIPVWWHTYTGDDPWAFAITRNLATRRLEYDELAFIGAKITPRPTGLIGPDPERLVTPNRKRLAELLHLSRHAIERARRTVVNGVDGLEECVVKHGVPIQTAARMSALPADEQHEFVTKVFGGMSPQRAAGRLSPEPPKKRGPRIPRNQHVNGARYRYIRREGIAAIRDSMAVLRNLFDSTEGLAPEIDAAEAAQWLNDLGRERRNLNRLMNLLKERTQ